MKKLLVWSASANGSAVCGLVLSSLLVIASGLSEELTASGWGLLLLWCVASGCCEMFHWGAGFVLRRWEKRP